ncbi:hypothetical protein FVE85_4158 [Porphyridium purpureum]|uniref:Uncharacterized protein n=1 Tax=Porphyridium purpureum TaxID=35688 RepID=A0A5J4YTT9_PORPP|nr:hypothetical protein FVE85_4158 [Porphyridium purpureum]|eukprot:POR7634..scf229_5
MRALTWRGHVHSAREGKADDDGVARQRGSGEGACGWWAAWLPLAAVGPNASAGGGRPLMPYGASSARSGRASVVVGVAVISVLLLLGMIAKLRWSVRRGGGAASSPAQATSAREGAPREADGRLAGEMILKVPAPAQKGATWPDENGRDTHPADDVTWDDVAHDVVICIKTGPEVQDQRLAEARRTWMRDRNIPNLVVLSTVRVELWAGFFSVDIHEYAERLAEKVNFNMNGVLFHDGWAGDKDKNLPGVSFLYREFPKKKVYVMIDDDTYLFLDNLAHNLLRERDQSLSKVWHHAFRKPVFAGRLYRVDKCWIYSVKRGSNLLFAHGGSGIIMNNAALRRLYPTIPSCMKRISPHCWAGDAILAACMDEVHIRASRSRLVNGEHLSWALLGPERKKLGRPLLWASALRIVSMHQLPPHEMDLLARFERIQDPHRPRTFAELKAYALAPEQNLTLTPRRWYKKKKELEQQQPELRQREPHHGDSQQRDHPQAVDDGQEGDPRQALGAIKEDEKSSVERLDRNEEGQPVMDEPGDDIADARAGRHDAVLEANMVHDREPPV